MESIYKSTTSVRSRATYVPSYFARGQLGGVHQCLWFMMACVLCPCHGGGRGVVGRAVLQFRYDGGHILMGWGLVMGGMDCSVYCGFWWGSAF